MLPASSSGRESSGTSSHIVPPSARKYSSLKSADLYQAGKDLGSQGGENGLVSMDLPGKKGLVFGRVGAPSESQLKSADCGGWSDCLGERQEVGPAGTCRPIPSSAKPRSSPPSLRIGTVRSG